MKSTDTEALQEGINQAMSLSERLAKIGGNLVVEEKALPIIPLAILAEKVMQTANEPVRVAIAFYHLAKVTQAYIEKSYDETLVFHGKLHYRFNPELGSEFSNMLGYMLLSADELDMAEVLFKRSIDLVRSNNSREPMDLALPTFNLGVVLAQREEFERALAEFQLCLNLVQDLDSEKRGLSCLWVPVILDETLAFEERDHPDLLEAVEEAKTSIEYVLTHK